MQPRQARGGGSACGPGEGAAARHGAGQRVQHRVTWRGPLPRGLRRGWEHDSGGAAAEEDKARLVWALRAERRARTGSSR